MKDDTISRQAALTALNGCTEIYLNNLPPTIYKEDAIKAVKAQPSATDTNVPTKQPGWIPVTERLPKPNEYENGVRKYYLVQNEYGDMMVCSWDGCFWTQMYRITHVGDKVVAWMELPTPYREGGHDGRPD